MYSIIGNDSRDAHDAGMAEQEARILERLEIHGQRLDPVHRHDAAERSADLDRLDRSSNPPARS